MSVEACAGGRSTLVTFLQVSATLRLLASAERTHLGDAKPLHVGSPVNLIDKMISADEFAQVVISVLQDSDELFTRNKRRKYSSARIEVLESLGRKRSGSRNVGMLQATMDVNA